MKRNIILILFLSAFILPLSAQTNSSDGQSFSIGIAYFGELITHPGISVFADYLILEKSRMRMSARLNLGYFYHQGNSHNVFFFPEAVITAMTDSSLFFDISAGGGWLYQKPSGEFVEYENEVFTAKAGGRSYFMPSIAVKTVFHLKQRVRTFW